MGEGSQPPTRIANDPPIFCLGIDHHRTPVETRERLAVDSASMAGLLTRLRACGGVGEAVVVSTCNRVEAWIAGRADAGLAPLLAEALCHERGIAPESLLATAYHRSGAAAVRHLFRVSASLESLVLGEDQILRQIKDAYAAANALGSTARWLNPLFQRAIATGREVRAETGISAHKLSIASVAVDLAKHIHGDLRAASLLVVGAGEMGELVTTYLIEAGVARISVVNRNRERAEAMAAAHGGVATVHDWSTLGERLADHDLVVTSTAAPQPIISVEMVRQAMRRRRAPLVLIDVAVPRDVAAEVGQIDDVFLSNVDHLQAMVAGNRERRQAEVAAAERLVEAAVSAFASEFRPGHGGLMARIATWSDDVVEREHRRVASKLPESLRGEVRQAMDRVAGKLQHRVLAWLRSRPNDPEAERLVAGMLGLDVADVPEQSGTQRGIPTKSPVESGQRHG